MPLQKLQFRPGLNREGTIYSNEGGWYDGDKIRFRSGLPEKIGGWTQVSNNQYNGICRSLWAWSDTGVGTGNTYIGLGTNTKYYIYFGGTYNDITPIVQTDTLTNPFKTSSGSSTVLVADNSYTPSRGDFVTFSGASSAGGILINGEYVVNAVYGSTAYSITSSSTATSTTTGGGTVTAAYEYPTGLAVYQTGTGWGAGPWSGFYGTGSSSNTGWGVAASTGIGEQLRLWSNDNFGADLVIAPRGGPVFYWQDSNGLGTRAQYLSSLANSNTLLTDNTSFNSGATAIDVSTTGSGYTNGTYQNVQLTYVSGPTMTTYPVASVFVSGGGVSSITITNGGIGALNKGTILSATNASIGGGIVTTLGSPTGGSGYTNGTYTNVPLLWVSGPTMAIYPAATVVVSGGVVTTVTLTNGGIGATAAGTVLYTPNIFVGGTGSGFQITTTAITGTGFTGTITAIGGTTNITISSANAPYVYPYMYITGSGIPAGTYIEYINNVTGLATISQSTTSSSSGSYNISYAGAFVPKETYQVITSAVQEFIICFGANSYSPGNPNTTFNSMLVRWSDQSNPYQWIPEVTNQSGEYTLTNGSQIIGARSTRQEILVWTDSAIYSMQYIGAPYVWGFQILMDNISVMGPNAMVTVNNITYWMGRDRFYMYDGTVKTLPCSLKQYVFEDLNSSQSYQVFAGANEGFNEVWWFYVNNESSSQQVNKYVVYNYLDNVWYYGSMNRSAWYQTGIVNYPVAADYNSRLLYHENGNDDSSTSSTQPIAAYIQSSDFDIGDGQNFGFVWRIIPDINFNSSTTNQPSVTMQVLPRQYSGSAYGTADNPTVQSSQNFATAPAYTVNQFTGQVYTRLRGRQMAFRIESTGLGVAWQLGAPRIDIRPDGRR